MILFYTGKVPIDDGRVKMDPYKHMCKFCHFGSDRKGQLREHLKSHSDQGMIFAYALSFDV